MQVHINIDVSEPIIEEAALNAIRTKIRELINQEANNMVEKIVREEVGRQVNHIKASTWKRDELTKKAIEAVDRATPEEMVKEKILDTIDKKLKSVADAAEKAVEEIQKIDIVTAVQNQTSNLVKTLFSQSLSKIIEDAVKNRPEE